MSPRTFVARSAALFALAALGLAACESKTVVQPSQNPLQILVTPSSLSFTKAGDKAQAVASLTGGDVGQAAQGVTWSSGNSAVATVDQSGNITAVANGTTTVIATSKALPSVTGAVSVSVNIPTTPPPPPVAAPTVSIQSITDNAGNNVDITNAGGQINVALNVDVPAGNTISSVNVLVDGVVQCSQTFSAGNAGVGVEAANAVTIVCPINTLKLDATGKPVFANGPHTITATLVAPGGTIKAQTSQSITFANVSAVAVAVTTTKGPAINQNTGIAWVGGDITATATPILFGGSPIAQVTFNLTTKSGVCPQSKTITAAPFTYTFPSSADCAHSGISDLSDSVQVTVTAVTAAGQTFTGFVGVQKLAFDNVPPAVTAWSTTNTLAAGWVNGPFAFGSTSSPANFAASDAANGQTGSNNVKVTFQAASQSDTTANGGWKTITTGADLAQTASKSMVLRVILTDALGNTKIWYFNGTAAGTSKFANATTFGVDFGAPTLVVDSTASTVLDNDFVNTTSGNLTVFMVQDTGSFISGPTGIQYKVKQFLPDGTVNCLTISSGSCVFGSTIAADYSNFTKGLTSATTSVPIPSGAGYDSVYVQSFDVAGNASPVMAFLVLQDANAPAMAGLLGPTSFVGGKSMSVTTAATDDVDLNKFVASETFASGLVLSAGSSTIGTFGLPFTTSASPTFTLNPFITSVQGVTAMPAGVPVAGGSNASQLDAYVTDQAGQQSATSTLALAFPGNLAADGSAFNFGAALPAGRAVSAFTLTGTSPLCGTGCTTDPTSTTLTAKVSGPGGITANVPNFPNPFTQVNFYRLLSTAPAGTPATLIGTATLGGTSDNGTTRTYTYATTWNAPGTAGTYNVFAVGIDAAGHGLVQTIAIVVQ